MTRASIRGTVGSGAPALLLLALAACTGSTGGGASAARAGSPREAGAAYAGREQVLFGRQLVIQHDCGGCHGGDANPANPRWLSGARGPGNEFKIGPCNVNPAAQPCWITRPRNITPDNQTGIGRFSERQIFNAMRYGLRPGETPDVEITSTVPGQGNFPENPKYLAPPMPWTGWRHMPDEQIWAIAAYLKHGVKPVHNQVADSEGPPDFWASAYAAEEIGVYPAPPFPTATEEYRP